LLPPRHDASATVPHRPVQLEARLEEAVEPDHHCPEHSHFTAACETCQRARAAFLPYKSADPHPPAASRSFGFTDQMSPGMIHDLTENPLVASARRVGERYVEGQIVKDLLGFD
jgi:hypothetical protein